MRRILTSIVTVLALVGCTSRQDSSESSAEDSRSRQEVLFEDGNYAMFIHFGLYSKMEGVWKDKVYRGNAEWLMNSSQAGIPVDEYMAEAAGFNPSEFDADAIARLALDAGMKYIVITSKHHEGFAMFDSDACDFNIHDATPFGRDVMGELAEACHKRGLGIGFYYSQFQDWTCPGGGHGPKTDATGREVTFEEYFRTKCVPQVEELTTKYGEIELIWFDTPGTMDAKYSEELVELVHKNQPGCLVSSRVGNGLGDYETLGDMEVPPLNIGGRWEGIDVMQVGWGFSREDHEWKSPEYVLRTLLSTVARGGTFMMNVGPDHLGRIPEPAQESLRKAGQWVKKYPQAVYGAGASPWGHALQWGDAVTQGDRLILLVYEWPSDGILPLPGLRTPVRSARIAGGKTLKMTSIDGIPALKVPAMAPEEMVSVIELTFDGTPDVDGTFAVLPDCRTEMSAAFAEVDGGYVGKTGYMHRFGEWVTLWTARKLEEGASVRWTFDIPTEGYYDISLRFKGEGYPQFRLETDEGEVITNQQPARETYEWERMGWLRFSPGRHSVTVTFPDGDVSSLGISHLSIEKTI